MKKIIVIMMLLVSINLFAQKIQTESTIQYDKAVGGLQIQRLQFDDDNFGIKYDYKVDLAKKNKVNDVLGVFFPEIIEAKNFSLDLSVFKTGDWDVEDECFIDLTGKYKTKKFSAFLEVGRGINSKNGPRDYIIAHFGHSLFTVELANFSDHNYSNLDGFLRSKYYWLAIHPKYAFVALGNEIDRTWLLVGTKDLNNFGTFTCGDYDRKNGDFWIRTQFGFGQINQRFFSLDNYLVSTSYLIVPPFFYKHFSPVSTKGDYGLKFDGKRTGSLEKYEILASRKFGKLGQLAVGWQKEIPKTNGFIMEYYKDASLGKFNATFEFRYESIYNRFSGFITTGCQL